MNLPERIYTELPMDQRRAAQRSARRHGRVYGAARRAATTALSVAYLLLAQLLGVPGAREHWSRLGLGLRLTLRRANRVRPSQVQQLLSVPLDSVRYFEFDFFWTALRRRALTGAYLDVSSPRMLPVQIMRRFGHVKADLLNPDQQDLAVTRRLAGLCGLSARCQLWPQLLSDFEAADGSYDLITCMSVIEHIPDDLAAIRDMWRLLKPGGRLLISMPCAATAVEEYMNFNEYGLLESDANGFVFAQRFYDEAELNQRVYAVTGAPGQQAIYGERQRGTLHAMRHASVAAVNYPTWRIPYTMAQSCRTFARIDDLPGWGVVAMEFIKPAA